jgi:DNA-binding IclR family transcriptional regulator
VQSVSRALRILGQFSAQDPALSLAELGRRTGLHRTTVYRLVRTLEAEGFLALDGDAGAYRVGPAWAASLCSLGGNPILSDILSQDLQVLADSTGEGATLSVRRGDQVQIFRVISASSSFAPVLPPSELVPLSAYWNVHARIHLAYSSEDTRNRMSAVPAIRYTEKTVTDRAAIIAGLARTAAEGIAYSCEERRQGVCPIAVPVFSRGDVVAAAGLVIPVERFDEERLDRYTHALRATAATMGRRLEGGFTRAAQQNEPRNK